MRALSILRVSERVPPLRGGKEIHVSELTKVQVDRGHDVHVLFRSGNRSELAAPATVVEPVRPFRAVDGLMGTALFSHACARVAQERFRPDIVHLHGDFTEAWSLGHYARTANARTVLTVHGELNPRFARLSWAGFKNVDHFIALGGRVAEGLERCRVPGQRVSVMSSGLNMQLIRGVQADVIREPGLMLMVGSLDEVKNLHFVIETVMRMKSSVDIRLELIGDGPQRRDLEKLARGSDRIRFRGQLDRRRIYERLAAADLFVMASKSTKSKGEGIPTALLEAMALGRLCLVSTEASPKPVVTDDRCYWSFDPRDQRGLAQRIRTGLADADARERVGISARAAVQHLAWPHVAQRVEDIYRSVMSTGEVR